MGKVIAIICIALLIAGLAVPALAMTGSLVNGEIPVLDVEWTDESLTTQSFLHNESNISPIGNNPTGAYKGWWSISLTNRTTLAWSSVSIGAGAGDEVAIVQGVGLEDENGIIGTSLWANRTSTFQYFTSIGDGSRVYSNGATGLLWDSAKVNFATPVATGQKVTLKVYTDNSWYEGPWADTFCVCVTPNAVPEPGSLVALASGMIGLAGFAWRKKD